jgi:hypothetical protein
LVAVISKALHNTFDLFLDGGTTALVMEVMNENMMTPDEPIGKGRLAWSELEKALLSSSSETSDGGSNITSSVGVMMKQVDKAIAIDTGGKLHAKFSMSVSDLKKATVVAGQASSLSSVGSLSNSSSGGSASAGGGVPTAVESVEGDGICTLTVIQARDLQDVETFGVQDPYVKVLQYTSSRLLLQGQGNAASRVQEF